MKKNASLQLLMVAILLLSGCRNAATPAEQACIKNVIGTDDSLGAIRNYASQQVSLSQAIRDYVQGIEQIEFKDCPPAFTAAFGQHKKAWIEMLTITDKHPMLRGELHALFLQLAKSRDSVAFRQKQQLITDTWADVEKEMSSFKTTE